jgi:hypothetical protein
MAGIETLKAAPIHTPAAVASTQKVNKKNIALEYFL